MAAGNYAIICEQGATLIVNLTYKQANGVVFNLTGYDARMQVRETIESVDVVLELDVAAGRIVLGGVLGTIILEVTHQDTDALLAGEYVYDLELISPADQVTRLIEGSFSVVAQVTREAIP